MVEALVTNTKREAQLNKHKTKDFLKFVCLLGKEKGQDQFCYSYPQNANATWNLITHGSCSYKVLQIISTVSYWKRISTIDAQLRSS